MAARQEQHDARPDPISSRPRATRRASQAEVPDQGRHEEIRTVKRDEVMRPHLRIMGASASIWSARSRSRPPGNGATQQQAITAGPLYFLQQGSVNDGTALSEQDQNTLDALVRAAPTSAPSCSCKTPRSAWLAYSAIWAPSSRRSDILAKLPAFAAEQTKLEDARIAKSLTTKSIDWAMRPSRQPGPSAAAAHDHRDRQAEQPDRRWRERALTVR